MYNQDEITPQENLNRYIDLYLKDKRNNQDEFEIRFGTKHYNTITKISFENIISKIKSLGFRSENLDGETYLNITNEYADPKTGRMKRSNVRTTISGLHNIQKYCKENNLNPEKLPTGTSFLQKFSKTDSDNAYLKPIDFHDFHFRVNYKTERNLKVNKPEVVSLLQNWKDSKKVFRYIKRYSFTHTFLNLYPFKIDCSIVKTSNKKRDYISTYNIQESNVFNNPENYEIEIELLNSQAKFISTRGEEDTTDADLLLNRIRNGIKIILSGWQQTNFPISYREIQDMQKEYLSLIQKGGDKKRKSNMSYVGNRRITTRDFIGPSSISLETQNIVSLQEDANIPNINAPYTVTDKADGLRKLLFINKKGKIYLMDTNMNMQFTGSITKHNKYFNSILDGEHVINDREGGFINLYLCFDIYIINNRVVKQFPFYKSKEEEKEETFRLELMYKFVRGLDSKCVSGSYITPIVIKEKKFYSNLNSNIYEKCKIILDGMKDESMFSYETDGLIFTPSNKSVGSNVSNELTDPRKMTWQYSLKWKPSEFNTIDFLVTTLKDESGGDVIHNLFEDGVSLVSTDQISQYKTIILRVGFDENKHGFINPCQDVINENFPETIYSDNKNSYKPMPFIPYDPSPNFPIYKCNIKLDRQGQSKNMLTEDKKQIIEDNTIVEFRFEKINEKYWQWVPIRVRHDKTSDFRKGNRNFGNAYHVAESVWRSIHNPITEEMMATGKGIPDMVDENVYYNRTSKKTSTRGLRDFHNKYIKRKLIVDASKRGDTLIDMTVGKGGDLPKWIDAKLSFVFGVDIAKDNIENRIDGCCSRYLKMHKKYNTLPRALFAHANSSLNLSSGEAFFNEKGKHIMNALNGVGAKDKESLGMGVYRQFGKHREGFDIVSNMFSIHYFFENSETFHNFLQNVSENCKIGGYFVGCCYNGKKIFRKLRQKEPNQSIFLMSKEDTKMWDIKKLYDSNEFNDDETSLGYKIDVYQESINKTFSEYLVNFDFLTQSLETYGFVPIPINEAKHMGFTKSIGSFEDLFGNMQEELERKQLNKHNIGKSNMMTENEKKISFLNNYFIYKKIRNTNAKEISKMMTGKSEASKQDAESDEKQSLPEKRHVKKYAKKIVLPSK
tara:strand:+ start:10 stop:3378 length:3369 start_codon:yes stop_codon:yes gene_type:complete